MKTRSRPRAVTIGSETEHPYTTNAVLNISGMSFGAISRPAVLALSNGARAAGIWMNTGEGGLSRHHLEGGADIVFPDRYGEVRGTQRSGRHLR